MDTYVCTYEKSFEYNSLRCGCVVFSCVHSVWWGGGEVWTLWRDLCWVMGWLGRGVKEVGVRRDEMWERGIEEFE